MTQASKAERAQIETVEARLARVQALTESPTTYHWCEELQEWVVKAADIRAALVYDIKPDGAAASAR